MLERVFIKNFALVGSLDLRFEKGLVLLTGETGAGKSLLIGALSSLTGSRIESDLVLQRDEEAVVEATFSPPSEPLRHALSSMGIGTDGPLVIRRKLEKKGRNSAFVNGVAISLGQLKELAPGLIEINGQHQNMRLLDEKAHARILDAADEVKPSAGAVASLSEKVKKMLARYRLVLGKAGEMDARIASLEAEVAEISRVNPKEGEDEELRERRNILMNASRIIENLSSLRAAFSREEHSAVHLLKGALKNAEALSEFKPGWKAFAREIEAAKSALSEIGDEAEREAGDISFDPAELERTEERLFEIEKLKRRFGPGLGEVLSRLEASSKELQELRSMPLDREALNRELDDAFREYLSAAKKLSASRKRAAPELSRKICQALKPLAMEKARFEIAFDPRPADTPEDASEAGLEEAYFLFSANEGEPLKPLSKIASGGEMSRAALAILCSTESAGGPATVVFDEVDAGIGGRPAEKVGSYLSGLSAGKQIICITHLPQIAAFADQHIKVEKAAENGRTLVSARTLETMSGREEELARMLAGEKITESAVVHARELLKIAGSKKKR